VADPCPARAFVQLIENQTHNINATPLCLCTFGDGAGTGVSNLQWFESCASEAPPSCE